MTPTLTLIAALARYRRAAASAPDDPEPRMAMAELLSQMLRFEERNLMLIKGAIPGPKKGLVIIRNTVKPVK